MENQKKGAKKKGKGGKRGQRSSRKIGGLSDFATAKLLAHFESTGETRHEFDLNAYLDNDASEEIFGASGSDQRRRAQYRWKTIKEKKLKSYVKYLKKHNVQAGTRTTALYFSATLKPEENMMATKNSESSESEDETYIEGDEEEEEEYDEEEETYDEVLEEEEEGRRSSTTTTKTASTTKSGKPSTKAHPSMMFRSPERKKKAALPPKKKGSSTPTRPVQGKAARPNFVQVPHRQHVFGQTSALVAALPSLTPRCFIPHQWYFDQDGTNQHPWIIEVNQYAERNREFCIQWVEGMDQNNIFKRNGYHIRRSIAPRDFDLWTATIPEGFEPEYADRLVLVKGPSLDDWVKDGERYHARLDCPATKDAHNETSLAIQEGNSARQWAFYLICFPYGTVLDNQVFSPDEGTIPVELNPVQVDAKDDNPFQKDLRGMTVFWKIAVAGGKKTGSAKKTVEAKKMFK